MGVRILNSNKIGEISEGAVFFFFNKKIPLFCLDEGLKI